MSSSDVILDHYHHPRNFGTLPYATHHAATENLSCGDSLAMDIIVKDDIIEDVRWTGNGCALSQASASILSGVLRGKNIEYARRISKEDIFSFLGTETLSPARTRCALLPVGILARIFKKTRP